jgi:hypothetical protein
MLSAPSAIVTEMTHGFRYADLMLVPASGMVLRRISVAAPETRPA